MAAASRASGLGLEVFINMAGIILRHVVER